jgi:hypothetical protein
VAAEELELIHVPREDIQKLDEAGFTIDAISDLIHELAENVGRLNPRSTGLSVSEVEILRAGGAKGLPDQNPVRTNAIEQELW